jgi:hypothetical protein
VQLVQQLQEALAATAAASSEARGAKAGQAAAEAAAAAADSVRVRSASEDGVAGPVSPRTLQSIIAAATRVNEKNKKLKRQLQAMQGASSGVANSK